MSQKAQYLLDGETDNVAATAQIAAGLIAHSEGGEFVVKVWSPTADWDSGTVTVSILAEDGTAIPLQTFTEDGAYFGRVGKLERFVASVTDVAGASADLTCTLSR